MRDGDELTLRVKPNETTITPLALLPVPVPEPPPALEPAGEPCQDPWALPLSTCLPLFRCGKRALGRLCGAGLAAVGGYAEFVNTFADRPLGGSGAPFTLGRWLARLRGPVGGVAPNRDELGAVGG